MNPRERVLSALEFRSPDRVPRQVWIASWPRLHHPEEVAGLERRAMDPAATARPYRPSPRRQGDANAAGAYIDAWGCRFDCLRAGSGSEIGAHAVLTA